MRRKAGGSLQSSLAGKLVTQLMEHQSPMRSTYQSHIEPRALAQLWIMRASTVMGFGAACAPQRPLERVSELGGRACMLTGAQLDLRS